METEDKDRVLNYEGLYIFLEELKKYFIANPDERGAGRYLKCVNAIDGTVEWAEFPTLLTFKGTVDNDSQLPTTGNSPGDVWKVEHPGAEYVWILNPEGTEYIWEYLGELVRLTTHAGITDTATAGQVLVSKSNGAGGITYEWVTLNNNDTTYTFSLSGNTLTITPSYGSATAYTPTTVTSITAGRGLLGGTITSSGTIDIDTEVCTPTISSNASNAFSISYDSKNFIKKVFNDEATVTINVNFQTPASGTKYAKEVICRIDYDHTVDSESGSVVVKVAATGVSGTLANMYDADITDATKGISLSNGESLELVFTFWDKNDVSFNGGISEAIITRTAS